MIAWARPLAAVLAYGAPAAALAALLPVRGNLARWSLGALLGPVGLGLAALALRMAGCESGPAAWGALGFWLVAALARMKWRLYRRHNAPKG